MFKNEYFLSMTKAVQCVFWLSLDYLGKGYCWCVLFTPADYKLCNIYTCIFYLFTKTNTYKDEYTSFK